MEEERLRLSRDMLANLAREFQYYDKEVGGMKSDFTENCEMLEKKLVEENQERIVRGAEATRDCTKHFAKRYKEEGNPEKALETQRDYQLLEGMIEKYQAEPGYETLEILRRLKESIREKLMHTR